jgi:hypothetical protein
MTEEQARVLGDIIDFARRSADVASWGETIGSLEGATDEEAEAIVSAIEAAVDTA